MKVSSSVQVWYHKSYIVNMKLSITTPLVTISRYIPIHDIAYALYPQMATGLLFFHAFTGCDVTSYFTNREKKSAWKTWLAWPEVTDSFVTLALPYTRHVTRTCYAPPLSLSRNNVFLIIWIFEWKALQKTILHC